ncbi:MAG: class IV adenylate cyclase [Planctomycetaceae bacterium]|nr:class IV adenylate cyclase [Planctomycetaceae bacterium]
MADLAALRERLVQLGAELSERIEQADTYFAHPTRNFAQTDEALRLRRVGEENCITYKGPKIDRETKTRRELEVPLASGQAAFEQYTKLLVTLGFGVVATVRKRRERVHLAWHGHAVEVALDTVDRVGLFAELEVGTDENGIAEAKRAIASLAGQLGLAASERRSYLEMLLAGSS